MQVHSRLTAINNNISVRMQKQQFVLNYCSGHLHHPPGAVDQATGLKWPVDTSSSARLMSGNEIDDELCKNVDLLMSA